MINKLLTKILYWLLHRVFAIVYTDVDREKMNNWLAEQHGHEGLIAYFKYRDLLLLRKIAEGVKPDVYWTLVGQRMELLLMIGKMKEQFEAKQRKKKRVVGERSAAPRSARVENERV